MSLGVRKDSPTAAAITDADGDYSTFIVDQYGRQFVLVSTTGTVVDAIYSSCNALGDPSGNMRPLASGGYHFDGSLMQRVRTPSIAKTASVTAAGNTTIWTPASGKKFRLMRLMVMVTSNAITGAGAIEVITFFDDTTDLGIGLSVYVPAAATATIALLTTPWLDFGNGMLSTAPDNVLRMNLGTALTGGVCRVTCVGTEE